MCRVLEQMLAEGLAIGPGETPSAVCTHRLPLAEVQHRIATDWPGLGHQLGIP